MDDKLLERAMRYAQYGVMIGGVEHSPQAFKEFIEKHGYKLVKFTKKDKPDYQFEG